MRRRLAGGVAPSVVEEAAPPSVHVVARTRVAQRAHARALLLGAA